MKIIVDVSLPLLLDVEGAFVKAGPPTYARTVGSMCVKPTGDVERSIQPWEAVEER